MKSKPTKSHTNYSQLSLFEAITIPTPTPLNVPSSPSEVAETANEDEIGLEVCEAITPPPRSLSNHLITEHYEDEWWTTKMVCRYLKLGRKAIWTKRRDPKFDFPKPIWFWNSHYRWRSSEIKQWTLSKNTPIQ